jgi:hypothetical protein
VKTTNVKSDENLLNAIRSYVHGLTESLTQLQQSPSGQKSIKEVKTFLLYIK